jgi:predicted amidohydrolase
VPDPLVVAVAQPWCVALDVAANAIRHADCVRSAESRVVIFPELSLTGYALAAPTVDPADPRLQPLVRACADTGSVALAGAPVAGPDGHRHIGVLAVDGAGATVAYHKMWLGTEEARRFRPGAKPAVVTVAGWRLGLAVCKDTGVPQHAADTAALGIDVYAAGTVKRPDEAATQAERAQRIATEHGVWVAVASCAGPTGGDYPDTAGRSAIWSPDGRIVVAAGPDPGEVVRGTLLSPP